MINYSESPTIARLCRDVEAGNQTALENFWQSIMTNGTPLIEECADNGYSLVTFLWRGEANQVTLFGATYDWTDLRRTELHRVTETDLWYLTLRLPSDTRTQYLFIIDEPMNDLSGGEDLLINILARKSKPDLLNPRVVLPPQKSNSNWVRSILELPQAPAQPWLTKRTNLAAGNLELHYLKSKALNDERRILIYTPAHYNPTHSYPLTILLDGASYLKAGQVTTTLDNLIAAERIPATIAVFVARPTDNATCWQEYGCYRPFVDFLTEELLPFVNERHPVTHDPLARTICGYSIGGLAAAFAGFSASDVFGNVLSQSGSFWWPGRKNNAQPEWLTDQFAKTPQLPLRFHLDVGLFEQTNDSSLGINLLQANRNLRNILTGKGYSFHYQEFNSGHDMVTWRGAIADGLIALLGNNKTNEL